MIRLALLCLIILSGCSAAIPVVVAVSYVSAQTAMVYAPDSIERRAP